MTHNPLEILTLLLDPMADRVESGILWKLCGRLLPVQHWSPLVGISPW